MGKLSKGCFIFRCFPVFWWKVAVYKKEFVKDTGHRQSMSAHHKVTPLVVL